jgi:alpha-N-arabinofuranosidase
MSFSQYIKSLAVMMAMAVAWAPSPVEAQAAKESEVAFESFRYTGVDPAAKGLRPGTFLNPILAGTFPDPSICRAGDDFYLVNSTIAYYPGIPILHSRDLVDWKIVGHALTRPSQTEALREANTGTGVYAPTIAFHKGKFYVTCTLVGRGGGNFVVTAERPEGPWSDPIWFRQIQGIDPSVFFDDDGKAYFIHNGDAPDRKPLYNGHRAIYLWQVDVEQGKVISGPKLVVNGGTDLAKKPIWIEAPHLLKKDGWYYLLCAEGGTGPAHSEVAFRSRTVDGPYEPFAANPILTQRNLSPSRPNPVTCAGHADLVQLANGDWWAVFLGSRPIKDGHVLTGRETFLLPVQWRDGWPIILEKDAVLPRVLPRPAVAAVANAADAASPMTGDFTYLDEFDAPKLDLGWIMYRSPQSEWWRIDAGALRVKPLNVPLTSRRENASFLGRRLQHADYRAEAAVDVAGVSGAADVGLAVFQDERHHFFLGVRAKDGVAPEVFVERTNVAGRGPRAEGSPEVLKKVALPAGVQRVELRVTGKGLELAFAYRTRPDGEWTTVHDGADASILSERSAGGFTGVAVGLHARTTPQQ